MSKSQKWTSKVRKGRDKTILRITKSEMKYYIKNNNENLEYVIGGVISFFQSLFTSNQMIMSSGSSASATGSSQVSLSHAPPQWQASTSRDNYLFWVLAQTLIDYPQ